MNCLLLYYSFTGEAKRAAEAAVSACRSLGVTPTLCAIDFAEPGEAPHRPFDIAAAKFWADAAQQGKTFAMRYDPPEAITGDYDLVFLFSNTWGGMPAVPVRSFMESDAAAILDGRAFGVIAVCRRLWEKNTAEVRRLGEARGGRFVGQDGLIHFGSQIGSLIQTVTYLFRTDSGRRRLFGIPLPRYGLSDASLARVPAIVRTMIEAARR
ncbi:flavodoxin family protein [Sphingomonas aliaeris]|uniref:Flavodoxin family protein n=2 Tax=Sphingomonas aliaeris TaxID=2759526 RepID=A0A974NVB7_9SPHN|nr:flavodoxin family protein [Sphingomonas aliaeris]